MFRILLRWSWRDLRARGLQVVAIALILAIGTGSFAAFNSMTRWRTQSNEASYELTNVHDLRARLGAGALLPEGSLLDAARGIEHADRIAGAEERLVLPTQVEVSGGGEDGAEDVLVRGRLVGMDLEAGGPRVDVPYVEEGRALQPADAGEAVALLEFNFARHYELPAQGAVRLAGGHIVDYVGQATHPESFMVVTEEGEVLAEANFASVFTSLATAGDLVGQPGSVNDLVVTLVDGADRDTVQAELAEALGPLGASVITIDDDPSYRMVVRDVEGDDQTTTVITFAVFIGALFAAFNLTARMVEAQRREIGIGMALGVPRPLIALRPLLVGVQIALAGAVLGIGVGLLLGEGIGALLYEVLPTPVIETPFQPDVFLRAAALGVVAPVAAIAYPVWRAVRVAPVDAIRTGHLAARGWGLSPIVQRLPQPGGPMARMPLRNLVRAPNRTLLTLLGIAATIAVLIGVLGALDAFADAGDRSERALVGDEAGRLVVELDTLYPVSAPEFLAVAGSDALDRGEPLTRLRATLLPGGDGEAFEASVEFVDFGSTLWAPVLDGGRTPDAGAEGIVLAEKAGRDLGVSPGDTVRLRHPVRTADGFEVVESELPVLGFHIGAFRGFAYMDRSQLDRFGLAETANAVTAVPATGLDETDVKRALFDLPAVSTVQSAAGLASSFVQALENLAAFFYVLVAAALALAGLIAFNSASINADERRREHATMFAFGVPVRRVLLAAVGENALLGLLATLVGLLAGYVFIQWLVRVTLASTMPDLGARAVLSWQTLAIGIVLGVVVVAITPVFTLRRMLRMDIPSTLRVME